MGRGYFLAIDRGPPSRNHRLGSGRLSFFAARPNAPAFSTRVTATTCKRPFLAVVAYRISMKSNARPEMPALKDGYVSSPGRRRVPRDGTCPAGVELGAPRGTCRFRNAEIHDEIPTCVTHY
jgi:hypothetical protein